MHDHDEGQDDRHENDRDDEDTRSYIHTRSCYIYDDRIHGSSGLVALLAGTLRLQLTKLLRDGVFGLELRELVLEPFSAAEIVRLDVRLDVVDAPLELIEPNQRVVDARVVQALPSVEPTARRPLPGQDRLLTRLRVDELFLEPHDVVVELVETFAEGLMLSAQRVGRRRRARLLGERRLREILAILVERELGLRLPIARLGFEIRQRARDLLAIRDGAGRRRANLDERVLHLLDHEAHEF